MVRHGGEGREPCPDRIINDAGGGFAMGAIGGSVYHFIRGTRGAMKGRRLASGLERVRMKAPGTAGGFAVWGGLYSIFDCSLVFIRQKEDAWNSIAAGACTMGLLSLRSGPRAVAASAIVGGTMLAMIEGFVIFSGRIQAQMEQQAMQQQQQQPDVASDIPNPYFVPTPEPELISDNSAGKSSSVSSSSSWYGRLFGWGKKKNDDSILESFDTPTAPVFYDYK